MADELPPIAERRTVFLSHANPADNTFTQWLALRLAREGYEVWCDLTKLLGGDDFWLDIEQALRQKTRKVVYVLSRTSNQAGGVLKEIAVAAAIGRRLNDPSFIIPVKIDDLSYAEHNIEISRLNALNFARGWAVGLADLLRTLDEEGVPRSTVSGPSTVAAWWNSHQLNRGLVSETAQPHFTNFFPITGMPTGIWVWKVPSGQRPPERVNWPTYRVGDRYLSFASARELLGHDGSPTGGRGYQIALDLEREPPREVGLSRNLLRTAIRQLLRESWSRIAEQRQLPLYHLSSRRRTLWFPCGSVSPNGVSFVGIDGTRSDRQLYGYKTVGLHKVKRFYHYGLEAQVVLYPQLMLALKSHVIFSLDGNTPHPDAAYQHRARRSQCKMWWNDRWRDLLLAGMSAIGRTDGKITLPLKPDCNASISMLPLVLQSPVSYRDEDVKEPVIEHVEGADDSTDDLDQYEGEEDDGNE